jgi:hypothetical protein
MEEVLLVAVAVVERLSLSEIEPRARAQINLVGWDFHGGGEE